ncbi:hypothetical protein F4781DRAFT_383430 [Annulohypoxylon bovei var. microspora]|nr:hypothetical protein F4781DRAFT_383430 [Annulohypoxylon bovei var. microspora]
MSANTTTPEEPLPPRVTFGVELEFLVAFRLSDNDVDPLSNVKGLPGLFKVPVQEPYAEEALQLAIMDLFENQGLEVGVKTHRYRNEYAKRVLNEFSHWNIGNDPTIQPDESNAEYNWGRCGWVDVEIGSPVEPAVPGAFEIVDYVRQLMTSNFRCRVNPSCGLHVHVGKGSERYDLRDMRRISSLIWSAEHLFVSLNHPSRQATYMTPTCRTRSKISGGRGLGPVHERMPAGPQQCLDYLAAEIRHGEEPIAWKEMHQLKVYRDGFLETRQDGHYEPFQSKNPDDPPSDADVLAEENMPSIHEEILGRAEKMAAKSGFQLSAEPSRPIRTRRIGQVVNPRYTPEQLDALAESVKDYGGAGLTFDNLAKDPGVFEGVRQLYESPSSCDISWLMYPGGRGYVNFTMYDCGELRDLFGKRTIEFRGAEGTLDSWVTTWARICVGMIKFALYSPVDEFLRVLTKCDRSNRGIEDFDCIDFLDEIGLPAEAILAEDHLMENEEAWGMKYDLPKSK